MPIKLKNKTNLIVKETGRPVFKLDGENVSEKSATIKVDDFWVNLPSIHGNMRYSEDELYNMLMNDEIKATSVHKKQTDAIKAAKERSKNLTIIKGSGFNQGGYGVAGKFTPDTGVSAAKEKGNFKGLGYKGEAKEAPAETKPYGGFQESVDMSSKGDDDKSASASVTLDRIKKNQLAQTKFTPANFQDPLSGQFDQYKKVDPETYSGLKFQQTDKDEPLGFLGEPANQTLKERQEEVEKVKRYSGLSETSEMAVGRVNFNNVRKALNFDIEKKKSDKEFQYAYDNLFPDVVKSIIDKNYFIRDVVSDNEDLGTYKTVWSSNLNEKDDFLVVAQFIAEAIGGNAADINPTDDKWAWCSAFVDHILSSVGAERVFIAGESYAPVRATSYLNYGEEVKGGIKGGKTGDILVLQTNQTAAMDHTGFLIGSELYDI